MNTDNNMLEDDMDTDLDIEIDLNDLGLLDNDNSDDSEEVSVTIDSTTHELVAKAAQVADYHLRSSKLSHLSVWDFVTSVDKVRIPKKNEDSDQIRISENNIENFQHNVENECDNEVSDTAMYFKEGHCE